MAKYFTRAEAEALLPRIEPILLELRDSREQLEILRQELEALQLKMRGNGHSHLGELAEKRGSAARMVTTINARVREINHMGVLVKDLAMGLIDFPAERDGDEILLCWRLGEPRIAWWHTFEGGFGARQPLED